MYAHTKSIMLDIAKPRCLIVAPSCYSHGEYRHWVPGSMPLLAGSGRGKGVGTAASERRGEGVGTTARGGCRGEWAGAAAERA